MTSYTIQAGDTLTSIARRFAVSIADIATANGIDDVNMIRTGDTLTIPDGAPSAPVTVDQSGNVINSPVATVPAPGNAVATFDFSDWFKPPKLYFTLAAIAAAAYFLTRRDKR